MSLMYPQDSWRLARSASDMRSEMARERHDKRQQQRDEHDKRTGPAQAKQPLDTKRMILSPIGLAVIAFLITFLALVWINPPLVQEPPAQPYQMASPNYRSVATYAGVVAALAFVAPYAARYFS